MVYAKKHQNKKISFIIPVFNQEKNIKKNIVRLISKLKKINYEIIIVNDGSNDKTFNEIVTLQNKIKNIKLINNKNNKGKGYSIRKAAKSIDPKSNKIIMIDGDLPYFRYLNTMINTLLNNNLVIIDRKHSRSKLIIKKLSLYILMRITVGHCLNFIARSFGLIDIKDTQAGLKGFDAKFKYIFNIIKTNGFLYDLEMMTIFKNKKIYPVLIPCKYSVSSRSSIFFRPKFILNILFDFLLIINLYFRGKYKIK